MSAASAETNMTSPRVFRAIAHIFATVRLAAAVTHYRDGRNRARETGEGECRSCGVEERRAEARACAGRRGRGRVAGVMRTVRAGCLAIPSRAAQQLPHLTAHDVSEIDREVLIEMGNQRGVWTMDRIAQALPVASIVIGLIAAIFGIRAATVTIRDNQDKFISDLGRQSRWASYAAAAAALAT